MLRYDIRPNRRQVHILKRLIEIEILKHTWQLEILYFFFNIFL